MPATSPPQSPPRNWKAEDLRKLGAAERDAILAAAAKAAEADYHDDSDLTAFDAFGAGDLYGDSSSAEPR